MIFFRATHAKAEFESYDPEKQLLGKTVFINLDEVLAICECAENDRSAGSIVHYKSGRNTKITETPEQLFENNISDEFISAYAPIFTRAK